MDTKYWPCLTAPLLILTTILLADSQYNLTSPSDPMHGVETTLQTRVCDSVPRSSKIASTFESWIEDRLPALPYEILSTDDKIYQIKLASECLLTLNKWTDLVYDPQFGFTTSLSGESFVETNDCGTSFFVNKKTSIRVNPFSRVNIKIDKNDEFLVTLFEGAYKVIAEENATEHTQIKKQSYFNSSGSLTSKKDCDTAKVRSWIKNATIIGSDETGIFKMKTRSGESPSKNEN